MRQHIVVLVPGYFGFARLGSTFYFSDRIGALLVGALQSSLREPISVHAIPTRPSGSLAERQIYLMRWLRRLCAKFDRTPTIHLVGHSAGGVDIELLTHKNPLQPGSDWLSLDPQGIRHSICNVVTIASPHYGTTMCESSVINVLKQPLANVNEWPVVAALLASTGFLFLDRPWLRAAPLQALMSGSRANSLRFVAELISQRGLYFDLSPQNMQQIHAQNPQVIPARIACFATAVPSKPVSVHGRARMPDPFFRQIHALTVAGAESPPEAPVLRALEILRQADPSSAFIRNPDAELPIFDAIINDGVCNSARQIITDGLDSSPKLAKIILADHADVLGDYDRTDPLSGDRPLNMGFFRSGSGFGDDQFFEVYAHVAQELSLGACRA